MTEPDESLDEAAHEADRRELRMVVVITVIASLAVLVTSLLIIASGQRP